MGDEGDGPLVRVALPTVAEALELPALRVGRPEVLAGGEHLDRRVRWVHVGEIPDIAGLLLGGELILSTGIGLPDGDDELRRYAAGLVEAGAAGLVVELGRRFRRLPPPLVQAMERGNLPLVALHREVRFVRITEAIHTWIVEQQFEVLRASERAHERFTALCVRGASPAEIVAEVADLAGCPVIFEDLMHRVVAHAAADMPVDDLLRNWEARSRMARADGRTAVCGDERWAVTDVEARGEAWGRLVLLPSGEPSQIQLLVLERGATALTLNRLLERNRESLERQAHRSTLSDIIDGRYASPQDIAARTAALGVPIDQSALVAVIVEPEHGPDEPVGPLAAGPLAAEPVAAAARAAGARALVGALDGRRVGALLALPGPAGRPGVLDRFARGVHERLGRPATVAAGTTARDLAEVRRSFAEAHQVADAAPPPGTGHHRPYYELPDIQLRGLLYILGDDPRLQAFVERTLGPLLDHDNRHGTNLLETLRAYVAHGGNKSEAAAAAHLSRQSLYQRLAAIERVLGVSLESADVRTSLHAAVMSLDSTGPSAR
ncbi:PucR family transcriptional regulator [Actinomadura litoris]|uniref:PucR family transcriptional regulator n=1 Tax=Actinomadura litoris TaxID=2678616 RepID=A0A7K1L2J3_9ACTN|nr:PucR family transcriptional regulator ligand-binding domain-containing protein [Actinomadura litoris]MUN38485.1 PucR family transcriptional regulator [Actinomadura litoris]